MDKNKIYTISEVRRIADDNEIFTTEAGFVYIKENNKKCYIQKIGDDKWQKESF